MKLEMTSTKRSVKQMAKLIQTVFTKHLIYSLCRLAKGF